MPLLPQKRGVSAASDGGHLFGSTAAVRERMPGPAALARLNRFALLGHPGSAGSAAPGGQRTLPRRIFRAAGEVASNAVFGKRPDCGCLHGRARKRIGPFLPHGNF